MKLRVRSSAVLAGTIPHAIPARADRDDKVEAEMAEDLQAQEQASELFVVQHAVVIQSGDNIHAVNDLLSAGWRVVQTANLADGALLILETSGTEDSIEALRSTLGFASE